MSLVPVAYEARGESTSPRWCYAFAQGCNGVNVIDNALHPGPVALFGSPRLWTAILSQARAEGRDWYYGDHAYFGRQKYYRITKNKFQHSGIGDPDYGRLKNLSINIRPWRRGGQHIVICPPDKMFSELMGFDSASWLRNICYALRCHTERPITIRQRKDVGKIRPLGEDLKNAWALVTYMSNAATEAVLDGIPVFCTGYCAAQTMGFNDLIRIEKPAYPDWREKWAATLAANQWTLAEMAAGDCWRKIGT